MSADGNALGRQPVRIAGLGGSLRRDSLNRHLLRAAMRLAPEGAVAEELDVGTLPPYDQDSDPGMGGGSPPPSVARFSEAIQRADGLVLVSPEYNWGVPGFLKNAVDWVSHPPRASVMVGRPTLLMGASTGPAGAGRAQLAWRQVLLSMRTPVLIDALQVPFAHERIERDGTIDPPLIEQIASLMATLVEEAGLARSRRLPETLSQPSSKPVAGVYSNEEGR